MSLLLQKIIFSWVWEFVGKFKLILGELANLIFRFLSLTLSFFRVSSCWILFSIEQYGPLFPRPFEIFNKSKGSCSRKSFQNVFNSALTILLILLSGSSYRGTTLICWSKWGTYVMFTQVHSILSKCFIKQSNLHYRADRGRIWKRFFTWQQCSCAWVNALNVQTQRMTPAWHRLYLTQCWQ